VRNEEWQIVCSVPVLQEVMRTYHRRPGKYDEMRNLVFDAVNTGWLIDLNFRYIAELHNKGPLPITDRYLNREKRKQAKHLSAKRRVLLEVDEIAYSEALNFKAVHEDIRSGIYKHFGSLNGNPPKGMAQNYNDWFKNERDQEKWILGIIQGGIAKGKIPAKIAEGLKPSYDNCPSLWQYVSFSQVKIKLNVGGHEKIKDSDKVDADIYSCSPYYDVLYTEDSEFTKAINLIPENKIKVCNFEDLMSRLLSLE
jgi:hypothetical protein